MFHESPELCLLLEVDDRTDWMYTGDHAYRANLLWKSHEGQGLNIGDDVVLVERWVASRQESGEGLWVVATGGNGWRLATDDEDLAARIACVLPLPFWAVEDQSIPLEAEICAD